MKFLDKNTIQQNQFLSLFSETSPKTISSIFVDIHGNKVPLKKYIEQKDISKEDIKMVIDSISKKNEYLARFYDTSLRIPENLQIQEKPMTSNHLNNNQSVVYKNIIRNMFFKDILEKTTSGLENQKTFWNAVLDFYTKGIIDYKILTPSALHYIKEGRLGSVFSSFYFRASIMNPYLVFSIHESILKGTRVFTPTLGWGSYCYGLMESESIQEYVGTDVIPSVCRKTKEFGRTFYPEKSIDIYCCPSEELLENQVFMKKYKNHFDTVFFSPPYYRLELYYGKQQSTTKYKTYEEWLTQYWEKTIQLCFHVLKKGGKCCYILSGYGSETSTLHSYNLLKDMNEITKKYFRLIMTKPMYNKNIHMTRENHRETSEKIMIFCK